MKYAGTPTVEIPAGFVPLAGPYFKHEQWMVPRVTGDLARSGIEFLLVPVKTVYGTVGSEVWRKDQGTRQDASKSL